MKNFWQRFSDIAPLEMISSFRGRLLIIISLITIVIAISSGIINYHLTMRTARDEFQESFSMMSNILKSDIENWIYERKFEVVSMANNPLVQDALLKIINKETGYEQSTNDLQVLLAHFAQNRGIYDGMILLDTNGRVMVSEIIEYDNSLILIEDIYNRPLETGEVYFKDVYLSPNTNKPTISISAPVFAPGSSGEIQNIIGVMSFRITIQEVLEPLLASTANLGATGEVVLVNREGISLMDLRHRPGSGLKYQLQTEASARAARGEEGVGEFKDYTGAQVLAAYRYISDTGWGLVVKKGQEEIFAPWRAKAIIQIVVDIGMALLIIMLCSILLNGLIRPLRELTEGALAISSGDLDKRVVTGGTIEIAALRQAFNNMADNVQNRIDDKNKFHEVLKALLFSIDMNTLLRVTVESVARTYGYQVGAIYICDQEQGLLVLSATYGAAKGFSIQKISPTEGLIGEAIKNKEISVLRNIPSDSEYVIETFTGPIAPKSVLHIPLFFEEQLQGLLALASINTSEDEENDVMMMVADIMAVAINQARIFKQTQKMSNRLQVLNEELTAQNEELKTQSEELAAQSEELIAQRRDLEDKNQALERATQHKSEFLAKMSHELRTPLNAILGFSEALLDNLFGKLPNKQQECIEDIHSSGEHLLGLINDILDLSKIEAGRTDLARDHINPTQPLKEALAIIATEAGKKNIIIENKLESEDLLIYADPDKLKQIFLNLLSNAIKFSHNDGFVSIDVESQTDYLEFSVADNGIGIPPDKKRIIFEEFKQADNTISREYGGTGLGLTITHRLVELHGGHIWVESDFGHGSIFKFTIPKHTVSRITADTSITTSEAAPASDFSEVPTEESASLDETTVKAPKTGGGRKYSGNNSSALLEPSICKHLCPSDIQILLVDDDKHVRDYLTTLLESKGYHVTSTDNGGQAIKIALQEHHDIIILDLVMPDMSGFKVLKELSEHPGLKSKIVVFSAKDLTDDEKKEINRSTHLIYGKGMLSQDEFLSLIERLNGSDKGDSVENHTSYRR